LQKVSCELLICPMTWHSLQAIYAWSRLHKPHAESFFQGQICQATLDTNSASPVNTPFKVFIWQHWPSYHVGGALRSRAGQTAQDRSHGLRVGPISCDDKLKNGPVHWLFHLTMENDNFSLLPQTKYPEGEGVLVRGLYVG
jgi:hypothetical protein